MKISMIIPAAGSSTRHPPNKLLDKIGGKTVIVQTIELYLNHDFEIIVIIGHEYDKMTAAISSSIKKQIKIIKNNQYQSGLSQSIKKGVESAKKDCDYFGFSLGDKPFIEKETIDTILIQLETTTPKILIPTFKGISGHPTFFSQIYRDELLAISGDSGGRELLKQNKDVITYFPVNDPGIILDMDTYYTDQNEN
ncbi:MAG: nucleotidyltransferase family protein [Candidatus Marinimicrobia bacterium]|nr:nucleotidyltransferase family protein [Candidatus Neomarinimicrobiota bacterium]